MKARRLTSPPVHCRWCNQPIWDSYGRETVETRCCEFCRLRELALEDRRFSDEYNALVQRYEGE